MVGGSDSVRRSPGRIVFLCPDVTVPYGGIKVIYQMVGALVGAGFDAVVWHANTRTHVTWFANETPVLAAPQLKLARTDILVVPEMLGPSYAQTSAKARVVILNQSHFHIFRGAGLQNEWQGNYPGWPNAAAVITTSSTINEVVNFIVGDQIPIFNLRLRIDGEVFKPLQKRNTVVLLTRRQHEDLEMLTQLLHRSSRLQGWDILPTGGVNQAELAAVFGTARIFISLSAREGLGLPPAEAMASGCYVIGFTGGGGREFMLPEFCSPIDYPNLLDIVTEVERVADLWEAEPAMMGRKVDAARDFVLTHFAYDRFHDSLISTFKELARPGSAAHQDGEIYLLHYSAIKPPSKLEELIARASPLIPKGARRYWRRKRNLNVDS